jgi:hypothetical protein
MKGIRSLRELTRILDVDRRVRRLCLIRTDREVIALGGNGGGADTTVVLLPGNMHRFFDTRVREILCKPRNWDRAQ